MRSPIEWLARQSWPTRLMMAGAFASVSVIAWFMGYIWPWGYVMAVVPLLTPRRSSVEEDFYREVKPTDELAPVRAGREVAPEALEQTLGRMADATTSGFGVDKIRGVIEATTALGEGEEKRFQYLVVFAGRPTSLQLTVRRKGTDLLEVQALSDPGLVEHLR